MSATSITVPIVRDPAAPSTDAAFVSDTTAVCDCCETGTGSNFVDCGCVFQVYQSGPVAPYPINTPTFVADRYHIDIAGFTNASRAMNCAGFNGMFKLCGAPSLFGVSYLYALNNPSNPINIAMVLYGQNQLSDHPAPHWRLFIQILCSGTFTFDPVTYSYIVDVADFNGCGSAIMTFHDVFNPASTDCPVICATYPATIVISTEPGDLCNCLCGCFIAYPSFATKLYVRIYNIVSVPPLPPGVVLNMELDWPVSAIGSTFLDQHSIGGGIGWFGEQSGTIGGVFYDAKLAILCGCGTTGDTFGANRRYTCGFFMFGTFVTGGFGNFEINSIGQSFGTDCGVVGTCYYSGTITGSFGGHADVIVSCNPIP